jgi:hypothetical protein
MSGQEAGKKKLYEYLWFVSFVSLSLALSLLTLHHRWEHSTDPDLVFLATVAKEAGLASFVAFFLNLSVEWINRRRHIEQEASLVALIDSKHQERIESLLGGLRQEHQDLLRAFGDAIEKQHQTHTGKLLDDLNKKYNETSEALLRNVFKTVYERYIEPGVFEVIEAHVLRKDVMRKDYKSSLTIGKFAGENPENFVNLCFANTYEVVNLTDRTIDNPVVLSMIDITPGYEENCKFISAVVDGEKYSERDLAPFITSSGAFQKLVISHKLLPRASVKVTVLYNKVGPRNFAEVICTTIQMDSFVMETISHDPELQVLAMSLHPEPEEHLPHPVDAGYTTWKINHAILPGQGMVVFWHPKRDAKPRKEPAGQGSDALALN